MSPEERAEQRNDEIMALESVYETDLTVSNDDEYPKLNIAISAKAKNNSDIFFNITLECQYDEQYPLGPLNALIIYGAGYSLPDHHKSKLQQILEDEVENGVGSLVIYNIASALQELLQHIADNISKEEDIEALERKRREEEEQKRKFIGTAVTPESFMAWKKKFDQEREASKCKEVDDPNKIVKLTGKELFLRDSHLNESDLFFLKDEPEGEMEIDESLFDINDLDLNDLSD